MITITATLINVYQANDFTDKEGNVTQGKSKVQLLMETHLKNGGVKKELLDISIPASKVKQYQGKENEEVHVEVGIYGKEYGFYGV